MSDQEERAGLRAAILAYLMWGLLTVYWKQLHNLNPLDMIGWRILTALTVLLVIDAATGRLPAVVAALRNRTQLTKSAAAAALLIANWTAYVLAIVHNQVVQTALGYFLSPLVTTAIGVLFLHERVRPLARIALLFGAAAVVVLAAAYGHLPWVAIVLALTWSGYGFIKRGVALGPLESLTTELVLLALPAAVIVVAGLVRPAGLVTIATPFQWVLLLGTGVITALPLILFAYAAKRVPLTILGPINYLVPVINLLLGWLVYKEPTSTSRFVGFALVWIALTLMTIDMISNGRRIPKSGRLVRS